MYVSGHDMSIYINVTAVSNNEMKLIQANYYHGVHNHLCFTALRLKMYKLNTVLNQTICEMTNLYFVWAIWDGTNDNEGADGGREGP